MDPNREAKELFERYADMVYRISISYGHPPHLSEDIVQDVFLRYLRKKPHFENSGHEKAWFIRVAVNCCKSLSTSAWMKRVEPLEEADQIAMPPHYTEEHELYELLSRLPSKYRVLLYLRYYEDYPVKDIAALLHITPNLVSARLLRAKKQLKQELLKESTLLPRKEQI
ncbi:MAG: sigma-70 family RNA polymerase sigma factor [Roseburia sp.]|nr:sigma-70 family RNA polymerase sigma factor [Roseburia sp.]